MKKIIPSKLALCSALVITLVVVFSACASPSIVEPYYVDAFGYSYISPPKATDSIIIEVKYPIEQATIQTALHENVFRGGGERLSCHCCGGGDHLDWYYFTFGFWFYNIPGYFIDLVGAELFHRWTLQFGSTQYGFREWREANLRTFIEDFSLTAQDLIEAQEAYFGIPTHELDELIYWGRYGIHVDVHERADAQFWGIRFSSNDIEALFSNDVNVVWNVFPGQGILQDSNVYSPEWILSNIERAIYGEGLSLSEIDRIVHAAFFHSSLDTQSYEALTTLQTAQQTLSNPTTQQLTFNLNTGSDAMSFSATSTPSTIAPITLNSWDLIMDSVAMGGFEGRSEIPTGSPIREGYNFTGWYLDEDFTVAITETFRMPPRNITLYARWEVSNEPIVPPPQYFTLTFDLGGWDDVYPNHINPIPVREGAVILPLLSDLWNQLSREGYELSGWIKINNQNQEHHLRTGDTMPPNNLTLFAQWSPTANIWEPLDIQLDSSEIHQESTEVQAEPPEIDLEPAQ